MILEIHEDDYARLLLGQAPRDLRMADTPIAPPEVLAMLVDLARRVEVDFSPAAWLIVETGELVGLCSITKPPRNGVVEIGYGVAPSRQGRGSAGRAIAEIERWARTDPRVEALSAETSTTNLASQAVLTRNGFLPVGERVDDEDGALIVWRCSTQ
jgi:RimJ/RimL family protein N-acetyltransferase